MDDLISRAAAIDALDAMKICRPLDSDRYVISDCMNKIEDLQSAQPERVQSYWRLSDYQNEVDVANGNYSYICAYCNHSDIHAKTAIVPYCWHCGAEMRGAK